MVLLDYLFSMKTSFSTACALILATICASCSIFSREKPKPLPKAPVRTATLEVTPGITVLARLKLPPGFQPFAQTPPMWLEEGKEIAVLGLNNGRTMVLGFSGPGWQSGRVIAEDGEGGAVNGTIVDAAPSRDSLMLAYAVQDRNEHRVEVVVRDLISQGDGHAVSTFDGDFDVASLGWTDGFTIALALRNNPQPSAPAAQPTPAQDEQNASEESAVPRTPSSSPGLYLIGINGAVTAELVSLKCTLSPLRWSPQSRYAIGTGDANAPPIVVDWRANKCQRLNARAPIQVIDWSSDGNSCLYTEVGIDGQEAVYSYNIADGSTRLVAVSSGAAAYLATGETLALGNSQLSFKRASVSTAPLLAEIGRSAGQGEVQANSLGFMTTPEMLAASSMSYSRTGDMAAMVAYGADMGGTRKILVYAPATRNAFMIAWGAPRGVACLSWSPQGRYLAVVDGDAAESSLTIFEAPEKTQQR